MKRLAIGISGGVDSAVAAALLQEQGYDIEGVTLLLHGNEITADARAVCDKLSIPHHILDLRAEFTQLVVAPFVNSYTQGKTPNPCVNCNKTIKFGLLLDWALNHGFDGVATGHYAALQAVGNRLTIRQTASSKDQSYFLCMLSQHQLQHIVFPLAQLDKPTVRRYAQERQLLVASKKDSQDVCFIPDGDCEAFLSTRVQPQTGDLRDSSGTVIGQHNGLFRYTIGQRRGLGALGRKQYVHSLDATTNTVYVSDNNALFQSKLTANHANWMAYGAPIRPFTATARIRSTAKEAACTVNPLPDNRFEVVFGQPQRAITPGQAVVVYQTQLLVAGGIIL